MHDVKRSLPTPSGRYGVRQFDARTGDQSGGTIGVGWPSRYAAEVANPDTESWRFEVYDRWPSQTGSCEDDCQTACAYPGQFAECEVPA